MDKCTHFTKGIIAVVEQSNANTLIRNIVMRQTYNHGALF